MPAASGTSSAAEWTQEEPLKPAGLLAISHSKLQGNDGAPIVFCQPASLIAALSRRDRVPEGACVWLGPANVFEGSSSCRYGHVAHEEGYAPRLQLTPRLTPSVTPAKLPALIPSLLLSAGVEAPQAAGAEVAK